MWKIRWNQQDRRAYLYYYHHYKKKTIISNWAECKTSSNYFHKQETLWFLIKNHYAQSQILESAENLLTVIQPSLGGIFGFIWLVLHPHTNQTSGKEQPFKKNSLSANKPMCLMKSNDISFLLPFLPSLFLRRSRPESTHELLLAQSSLLVDSGDPMGRQGLNQGQLHARQVPSKLYYHFGPWVFDPLEPMGQEVEEKDGVS